MYIKFKDIRQNYLVLYISFVHNNVYDGKMTKFKKKINFFINYLLKCSGITFKTIFLNTVSLKSDLKKKTLILQLHT